jgi:hypothetical protein
MKRNLVVFSVAIFAVCLLALSNAHANRADDGINNTHVTQSDDGVATAKVKLTDEEKGEPIEGTWLVTVTPPPGGPPAYFGIASFARGGVMTTAPDPSVGPGVTSTGQGSWEKAFPGQFTSTHMAFIYGAGGAIVSTIKINSTYRTTGKNLFDGFGQLQICDATGNNCFFPGSPGVPPGCATLHGTRLRPTGPTCPF